MFAGEPLDALHFDKQARNASGRLSRSASPYQNEATVSRLRHYPKVYILIKSMCPQTAMPSQPWMININGSRGIALEIVDLPGIELEEHALDTMNLKVFQRVVIEPIEGVDVRENDGGTE